MTQTKEKQLVPVLRFKEFEGEWEKPKLSERMEVFRGASPRPKGDPRYYGGEIPRLMIKDVTRDGKYAFPCIDFLTEEGAKKSRLLKKGSIVLSCSGTRVAIPGILGIDACIHDGWLAFKNFKDIDKEFLYNLFVKLHEKMQGSATTGGVFNNLTTSIIRDLRMGFPSLPEQQKIASFLSAVDEKIQQLTQKKALLEQYKKGVMQQLFSGEMRFKQENGDDYLDWEEKEFSDLYSFHSTNSLSRSKLNYDVGSVYNIHYGDIHTKFKTAFKLLEEYIPFVNDDVDLSKIKADSYCKKGDLVMADASEDYADIGKTIELIDLKDEMVLAGLHTFLARPKTVNTTIGFFSVLLKSWGMRKQIMTIAQGTKVLSLSTGRVGKLRLGLPCIEEQQKIAAYLSSIDTKIESVADQITQTQTFKKGLLQQMFV